MPVKYHREQVVEKLKAHFAADHLEVDEFEFLLKVANETKSKKELLSLTADLPDIASPELPPLPQDVAPQVPLNTGPLRPQEHIVAIFSEQTKKGTWSPAKHAQVISAFGSCKLDFTDALWAPDVTHIHASAVFGEVQIWVPKGVNVEVAGTGILGEFQDKTPGITYPGAPVLRVDGFALFGEVKVRVRKEKTRIFSHLLNRLGFRG